MSVREWFDEREVDRRLLFLLLVVLLVLLGSGIGTIFLGDDAGDEPPGGTPTPGPVESPTPTPTVTSDGDPATSPTPTQTPTATDTPDTATPGEPKTPDDTTTATAAPTPTPTEAPSGGGDSGGGDSGDGDGDGGGDTPTPAGSLVFASDETLVSTAGVVPGQSGWGTVTFTNDGPADGTLRIADVGLEDRENGINDAEASVDDSPNEGELSEYVEVRIVFVDSSGTGQYVLGADDEWVTLSELTSRTPTNGIAFDANEQTTVRTEWRLPESTGNVVQTDGVDFDVTFELRSPDP